jgi:hypothetical protein
VYSTLPSPTHPSPSQQLKQDLLSQLGTAEKTGERREGEDLTKTLLEHVVKLKMVSPLHSKEENVPPSTEENGCIYLLLCMYEACTVLYSSYFMRQSQLLTFNINFMCIIQQRKKLLSRSDCLGWGLGILYTGLHVSGQSCD